MPSEFRSGSTSWNLESMVDLVQQIDPRSSRRRNSTEIETQKKMCGLGSSNEEKGHKLANHFLLPGAKGYFPAWNHRSTFNLGSHDHLNNISEAVTTSLIHTVSERPRKSTPGP